MSELRRRKVTFRRSLYFVRSLNKGDIITEKDIRSVRQDMVCLKVHNQL